MNFFPNGFSGLATSGDKKGTQYPAEHMAILPLKVEGLMEFRLGELAQKALMGESI